VQRAADGAQVVANRELGDEPIRRGLDEADAEELPPGMISATVAPPPSAESVLSGSPQVSLQTNASPASSGDTLTATPMQEPDPMNFAFLSIYGLLFGGQPRWPEAIGAAIAFEVDGYVVRTLIVNGAETKDNAIPFVPQFVTGPALVPASPNIFPADIDLFVAVSLDYNQIYQGMMKASADEEEASRKFSAQRVNGRAPAAEARHESPFAVYEKKLGLKIERSSHKIK